MSFKYLSPKFGAELHQPPVNLAQTLAGELSEIEENLNLMEKKMELP